MQRPKRPVLVVIFVVLLLSVTGQFSVRLDPEWFREKVLNLFSLSKGDLRHDALQP